MRLTQPILAGKSPAEVARITRNVAREYAERAAAGRDVTGPRRGTAWMTPDQLAQSDVVALGASMLPPEGMRPRGTAVTTRPLTAADREFSWGVQPGGGPAAARCESGHEIPAEASGCGICGAAPMDESPDPPLPPSRYPAEFGWMGR